MPDRSPGNFGYYCRRIEHRQSCVESGGVREIQNRHKENIHSLESAGSEETQEQA